MTCSVPGCQNGVHSRGLCRRHYGQQWRKGRVYLTEHDLGARKPVSADEEYAAVEIKACKLARAKESYENAVGLAARLFWKAQLKELGA